jgi:bisphosphoglycerate-dependent phosphoglycerate mutase
MANWDRIPNSLSQQYSRHNPFYFSKISPAITAKTTTIATISSRSGCVSCGSYARRNTYPSQPNKYQHKRDQSQETNHRPESSNGSYEQRAESVYYKYPETSPQYYSVVFTQQDLQIDTVVRGLSEEHLIVDCPSRERKSEHDHQWDNLVNEMRG